VHRHGIVLVAFLLAAIPAYAKPCGDALPGGRVACACGDTVTTDARILATDPVATSRCRVDGLIVRAARETETITLDLDGREIRGSGAGVGIRVMYGGTDGAQIVGAKAPARGAVAGFGIGLTAARPDAIARVTHLELRDNHDEGVRLTIAGTVFDDVVATRNGRDGISVRGSGGRFAGVRVSENSENGIRLFTDNAAVNVHASSNAMSGVIVDGTDNDLEKVESVGNGRDGVVTRGRGGTWEVSRCEDNARDDFRVNGRVPKGAEGSR